MKPIYLIGLALAAVVIFLRPRAALGGTVTVVPSGAARPLTAKQKADIERNPTDRHHPGL